MFLQTSIFVNKYIFQINKFIFIFYNILTIVTTDQQLSKLKSPIMDILSIVQIYSISNLVQLEKLIDHLPSILKN